MHKNLTTSKVIRSEFAFMIHVLQKKLFHISVIAGFLSCSGLDFAATAQRDDPIAGVLRQEKSSPAASLPVAPAASVPPQGAGPSPGSNAQGSQPIVLSARIGEHADRTRFVIELSDPINLRTFTLTNPDRVVVDMPEVQ